MRDNYRRILHLIVGIVVIATIISIPLRSFAQSFLQSWSEGPQFSVEFYNPEFSAYNYKGLTSLSFFSLRYPTRGNLILDADLPFVYYKNSSYYYSRYGGGRLAPGNPYLGMTVFYPNSPIAVNVGVRIPLMSYDDGNFARVANSVDFYRYSSASQRVGSFSFKIHYFGKIRSPLSYQIYVGGMASFLFAGVGDVQFWLPYGFAWRYKGNEAILGAGISGILNVSDLNISHGKRSLDHFYLNSGLNLKTWIPGIYIAFPIDKETRHTINLVYGLRVTLKLDRFGK